MRLAFLYALPILALGVPVSALAAGPVAPKTEHARPSIVTTWSVGFKKIASLQVFEDAHQNGGTLASGDVDGDGALDLIVGAGPDRLPDVRVFRLDGSPIGSFRAYPTWFKGGVRVAVGDVDGDGKAEIVTAPGPGIEPQINVFRLDGTRVVPGGVWAYARGFLGGVHVAAGDVDGDGKAEIVTAPGPSGGPHVRVWDGSMRPVRDFFAYDAGMTDGVTVAVLQTIWGSAIVTGVESWSAPLVRRFSSQGTLLKEFYAYTTSSRSGVNVTAWDMDGDGTDEIVTTPNGGMAADLRIHDLYGTESRRALVVDPNYRGGVSVAPLRGTNGASPGLFTMPLAPTVSGPTDTEKSIGVNLMQQRLYAYERGRVARTFLVSTGVARFPTPEMNVTVGEKIPIKDYKWNYGPGNPNNYFLPNVRWNLRIYGAFYIHYAYWHNNFGTRMSHGCVNVGKSDAEWIYTWANVGTPVAIYGGTLAEKAAGARIASTGP